MKEDREKALAIRFGKLEEKLNRNAKVLRILIPGDVVQIQNQKGREPLRWDKSGTVVESHGNDQYSVRMDGSGRITLRNRQYLRKIVPLFERMLGGEKDSEDPMGEGDIRS